MKVCGPYIYRTGRNAGRRYVIEIDDLGKRRQLLYSRWLMERHLGRRLSPDEHVDHRDEDPTNDELSNLQLLTPKANSQKSAVLRRSVEMMRFPCPQCGVETEKPAHKVRHNRKQGKAGPYCGKRCARLAQCLTTPTAEGRGSGP